MTNFITNFNQYLASKQLDIYIRVKDFSPVFLIRLILRVCLLNLIHLSLGFAVNSAVLLLLSLSYLPLGLVKLKSIPGWKW